MLELIAVKVARSVLRRGGDCEISSLSDNNAEFMFASQEEQNIANNSKRLIQNAIILWNYLYLTKKIQEAKTQEEKDEILKAVKQSSAVRWSHINFFGEYNFTSYSKKICNLIAIDKEKEFTLPLGLEN